ncbi:MAG TPA: alpha/beta hydrolase-fold protein [Methylomirabilota bacterium]|nr:alpha/beta hydrolase-fold protein [Methylomirabilota bacterium]
MKTRAFVLKCLSSLVAGTLFAVSLHGQNRPSPPPPVVSPEVSPDRKVTFRVQAPKAAEVRLSGGDIPGGTNLVRDFAKGTNGVWELTIGPIPPGAYRYSFNVDGMTTVDTRNVLVSESNQNIWSLVHVPGAEWMDNRDVPHGSVSEVTYWSSTLNRFRRLHVYTPPGYEAGSSRYPVFYLLHGASDSDNSWNTVGRAGVIMDNLLSAGKAKPMIVVMPHGHTGQSRAAGEFEKEFVVDIMPHVDKRYRTLADRNHRAIAGLSMGGAQTLNIGIPHLEQFAHLGVFSSGVFGIAGGQRGPQQQGPSFEERHKTQLTDPKLKEGLKVFWFATGKDDFLVQTSRATVEMFKKNGFNVIYKETEGAHTWDKWREYLNEFAPMLFQ